MNSLIEQLNVGQCQAETAPTHRAAASRRLPPGRDILEAALRLFERQGYSATSMAAVAAEAGVALKTVYLAFETKRGVLIALWHLLLRGDEAPVPVGERPWYREVIDEPDPEAAVAAERAKLAKRQGASRRALADPPKRRSR